MHMLCPAWSIVPPCGCRREVSFVLLNSVFRSVEGLCKGELCCLCHRRKVRSLCLLYKIYRRVEHPMNEYLNHFVTAYNIRALDELVLEVPRSRTDQFSQSLLPAAGCLWKSLSLGVFNGDTLSFLRTL